MDAAIASRDARLGERERSLADHGRQIELLDGVAECLARMVVERDRELGALRALVAQVEEIRAQARGQATKIRMQALRQAAQLAPRANGGTNGNGHALEGAVDVFDGLVHLEIGPLHDFSQLVRFEDAVTGLGAASEISVKRFSQGRATLAVRLDRPVELLRELEEHSPFELKVRSLKDDRLIVDVDER